MVNDEASRQTYRAVRLYTGAAAGDYNATGAKMIQLLFVKGNQNQF
jgi:hypothetical protein